MYFRIDTGLNLCSGWHHAHRVGTSQRKECSLLQDIVINTWISDAANSLLALGRQLHLLDCNRFTQYKFTQLFHCPAHQGRQCLRAQTCIVSIANLVLPGSNTKHKSRMSSYAEFLHRFRYEWMNEICIPVLAFSSKWANKPAPNWH